MNSTLEEHLLIFILSALFGLSLSFLAAAKGFYYWPEKKVNFLLSIGDILSVFGIFFIIELVIFPVIAGLWLTFEVKIPFGNRGYENLDSQMLGWLNLTAIFLSACAIILYAITRNSTKRQIIFWAGRAAKKGRRLYIDLAMGSFTWLLSYPIVVMIGQIAAIIFFIVGYEQQVDQVAVKNLKSVISYPFLLICTILTVVFIVPIGEEILFRGFFQNWIIQYLGRVKGIIVTSLLFASFHFSMSQDWTNIELLLSLFVLSCYLGFIYERQCSLWASAGLHGTFNAVSVLLIVIQN